MAQIRTLPYNWPGNVGELKNAIHRALLLRTLPPDFIEPVLRVSGAVLADSGTVRIV